MTGLKFIKANGQCGLIGSFYNSNANLVIDQTIFFRNLAKSLVKSIRIDPILSFKKSKDSKFKNKWNISNECETTKDTLDLEEFIEFCQKNKLKFNDDFFEEATHVITGIKWGFEVLFSIECLNNESADEQLALAYDNLRTSNLLENLNSQFKCEIKKNLDSDGNIVAFNDLKSYLYDMQKKIKEINDGKGYQIKFQLTSIEKIKKLLISYYPSKLSKAEYESLTSDLLQTKIIEINSTLYEPYHLLIQPITENFTIRTAKLKQKENNQKRKMITEIDRLSLNDWNLLKKLDHKKVEWNLDTELIKLNIPSELEIASYLMQLIKAVEYLHSLNILHSFINLKTIYVEKKKIRLGGFYFCQKLSTKEETVSKFENLYYKSPEEEISLPYDIWCIGLVLYEMCYIHSKRVRPVKDFINELEKDWSSECPNGFKEYLEQIKRFGKLVTNFIQYNPKMRPDLAIYVENNTLLKTEDERLKNEEIWTKNLQNFITEFNKKNEKNHNYTIEKQIDEGAFGVLFEVSCLNENTTKCLKRISMIDDLAQTTREIENLKTLTHPNVIKYFEMFEFDNHVCLITEYCKDGDLRNYLACLKYKAKNKLLIRKQIDFCYQLADGLKYIHENKIIHRDIKPANILLTDNNQTIKYADFGFSIKNNSVESFCQTRLGTVNYAAPEILKGILYSSKIDIWSLACVFYEIVTLDYAFDDKCQVNLLKAIIEDDLPRLVDDHPLEQLIRKMLIREECDRFNSNQTYEKIKFIKENYLETYEVKNEPLINNEVQKNNEATSIYFKKSEFSKKSVEISGNDLDTEYNQIKTQEPISNIENCFITEIRGYCNESNCRKFVLEFRDNPKQLDFKLLNTLFKSK